MYHRSMLCHDISPNTSSDPPLLLGYRGVDENNARQTSNRQNPPTARVPNSSPRMVNRDPRFTQRDCLDAVRHRLERVVVCDPLCGAQGLRQGIIIFAWRADRGRSCIVARLAHVRKRQKQGQMRGGRRVKETTGRYSSSVGLLRRGTHPSVCVCQYPSSSTTALSGYGCAQSGRRPWAPLTQPRRSLGQIHM